MEREELDRIASIKFSKKYDILYYKIEEEYIQNLFRESKEEILKMYLEFKNNSRIPLATLIPALFYIYCKRKNIGISARRIAEVFDIFVPEMLRAYRKICKTLKIEPKEQTTEAFLKTAEVCGVSAAIAKRARDILKKVKRRERAPLSPQSMAAAAIYVASIEKGSKVMMRELSALFTVSEPTLRKAIKFICQKLNCIILDDTVHYL